MTSIWLTQILDPIDIPKNAYDKARNQYEGLALLNALPEKEKPILGIAELDAYIEGLNFIFGLACGGKAFISLERLRPEFYGLPEDENLFKNRVLKEAVHEIGHVLSLKHCQDRRCVMHFSNSIWDTDFKNWEFCPSCKRKIEKQ